MFGDDSGFFHLGRFLFSDWRSLLYFLQIILLILYFR
jgi:hypothetical protein